MYRCSKSDWNWDFYKELVDDIEENKNIIGCINCGKCVGCLLYTSDAADE